jgi:predicted ester cyclase
VALPLKPPKGDGSREGKRIVGLELPPAAVSDRAREYLRRELTPELYSEIRELWKRHSIAEENRDLPGLIATLTDDCVYEIPDWGRRWEAHEGATRFYTELLTAFPDIHFALTEIVIGPQGVCEEAVVTGTHERDWLEAPASGRRLDFQVIIFFPWDSDRRLFTGERIHVSGLVAGPS